MRCKFLLAIFMLVSSTAYAEVKTGDLEVVYKTIAMESASEPLEWQVAVAGVILERSRGSRKSLEAVCLAPKQFSAWNTDSKAVRWRRAWLDRYYTPKARQNALKALNKAILEQSKGLNPGYTHYHNKDVRPYWSVGHKGVLIGKHKFYKGIK